MEELIIGTKKYYKESILVACDSGLIGKTFREGKLKLEISEKFYSGDKGTYKDLVKSLRTATIANLVGEKVIDCAIKNGFIKKENVINIQGIPYAQMMKMI